MGDSFELTPVEDRHVPKALEEATSDALRIAALLGLAAGHDARSLERALQRQLVSGGSDLQVQQVELAERLGTSSRSIRTWKAGWLSAPHLPPRPLDERTRKLLWLRFADLAHALGAALGPEDHARLLHSLQGMADALGLLKNKAPDDLAAEWGSSALPVRTGALDESRLSEAEPERRKQASARQELDFCHDGVSEPSADDSEHTQRRKVRHHQQRSRPRSKTIAMKQLTPEELRDSVILEIPPEIEAPKRREDCLAGGTNEMRPCPWVRCKHHLYLDVNPETGSFKLNFPDLEVSELKQSCSLDVADRGGTTLEEVGEIMNLTRERIRQVEVRGLFKLRYLGDGLDLPPTEGGG